MPSDGKSAVEINIETEYYSSITEDIHLELAEPIEEIATRLGHGDRIGRKVRVSGELTVEDIGPGRKERRRQRQKEKREEAIQRHAIAEGADR